MEIAKPPPRDPRHQAIVDRVEEQLAMLERGEEIPDE
jgi:hypothetical protein